MGPLMILLGKKSYIEATDKRTSKPEHNSYSQQNMPKRGAKIRNHTLIYSQHISEVGLLKVCQVQELGTSSVVLGLLEGLLVATPVL